MVCRLKALPLDLSPQVTKEPSVFTAANALKFEYTVFISMWIIYLK